MVDKTKAMLKSNYRKITSVGLALVIAVGAGAAAMFTFTQLDQDDTTRSVVTNNYDNDANYGFESSSENPLQRVCHSAG